MPMKCTKVEGVQTGEEYNRDLHRHRNHVSMRREKWMVTVKMKEEGGRLTSPDLALQPRSVSLGPRSVLDSNGLYLFNLLIRGTRIRIHVPGKFSKPKV